MPIHSCVGAIANIGQWEQGCSLFMATDLGPVRATRIKKKKKKFEKLFSLTNLFGVGNKIKTQYPFSIVKISKMVCLLSQRV